MSKKVLVATEKPFARQAVDQIREIIDQAGYELILLEKYTDAADLVKAVATVDALIIRSDKVTREVLGNGKDLKIVVRAGAGYDNVDLEAANAHEVVVMNTPGQNSNAVAELAFGLMVYMARGQFNGKSGTELRGKNLGIHAFGNVGMNVARIALGFDMEIFAYDPFVKPHIMAEYGVKAVTSELDLYSKCDYISLHLPLIPSTEKAVNYELLSSMKKGATLINTARKEVVCEDGLIKLFRERDDLKYASDIAPDKKEEMTTEFGNRVFFTPKKMGAQTEEANINAGLAAARQIIDFFKKGDRTFQVNK